MYRIEIVGLTISDLQQMLDNAIEKAILKYKEGESAPSEYEDITVEQAAAELYCSIKTVRRRMKELNIKGFRIGKKMSLQRKELKKIKRSALQ